MAFKFVILAAFVAVASAGGPAAYDISASSGDLSSIGYSQESTQKGYAGQNVVSSYTKSDDSAHSFVRVSSQSISNDGLLNYDIAHTPIVKAAYAAPSYVAQSAAPLVAKTYSAPYSYGAPLLTKSYAAPYSYSAPLVTKAYASPLSYSAPLLTKSYAAPATIYSKSYAAPIAAAPLIAKSYSAPLISAPAAPLFAKSYEYAAHAPVIAKSALIAPANGYAASIASAPLLTKSYAAPIASAPLLTKAYATPIASAPLLTKAYATPIASAPLLTKTYATAPLVTKVAQEIAPQAHYISKAYEYEAAAPVVHTVFNGLGTSYSW